MDVTYFYVIYFLLLNRSIVLAASCKATRIVLTGK